MKSQGILSLLLSHFDGRFFKKKQGIWEQDIHCLLATLPNLWTFWMSFLHFPSQCVWIDKKLSANLKVKLRPTVMTSPLFKKMEQIKTKQICKCICIINYTIMLPDLCIIHDSFFLKLWSFEQKSYPTNCFPNYIFLAWAWGAPLGKFHLATTILGCRQNPGWWFQPIRQTY